jgi:hypothetical protein
LPLPRPFACCLSTDEREVARGYDKCREYPQRRGLAGARCDAPLLELGSGEVRAAGPSGGGSAVVITASGRCSASYIRRVLVRESRKSASRKFAAQICADQANAYSMLKINGLRRRSKLCIKVYQSTLYIDILRPIAIGARKVPRPRLSVEHSQV